MSPTRRPYCLCCYAPLDPVEGASVACAHCGAVNLSVDQRLLWTRERRLVQLEWALKAVALLVSLALAYPLLFVPRGMHGFSGVGFAIGLPLVVGFLLWDAASLVTARRAILRHDLIWPLLPLTLVAGPVFVIGGLGLLTKGDLEPFGLVLVLGLPALALAAGLRRLVRWLASRRAAYLHARLAAWPIA